MIRWRYASYLSLLYVSALLALLGFLAVLQYRWTGEASLSEQERMRQGLRDSLLYFQRGFDTEILRIVEAYWQPPLSAREVGVDWRSEVAQTLGEASRQWHVSATDPRLVSRVLLAENADDRPPALYSFNPEENRLDPVDWPDTLLPFRDFFQTQFTARSSDPASHPDPGAREAFPAYSIWDEVPALISPRVLAPSPARETGQAEVRERSLRLPGRVQACLIVCLDSNYLFGDWIPALAQRYLSTAAQGGYDYVLRGRKEPRRVFCSSQNADVPGIISQPDEVVNLMGFPMEQPRRREPRVQRGGAETDRPVQLPVDDGEPPDTRRRRPAPGSNSGLPTNQTSEADRALVERAIERRQQLPRVAEMLADQGWQLLVKHRAGSLDAVVGKTRMRNLTLSLGILLLLAVSLVVLSVSVRRARALAKQQMEFVAGVSHELRTPIAVICSTAENLADGLITARDQVTQYGTFILREGRHLGTLVEQTLAFAGIESGRGNFKPRPLDIGGVVTRVVQDELRQASAKGIAIIQTVDAGLSPIAGDPASRDTAIRNLVGNAVKYSGPGTTVRVTVRRSTSNDAVEVIIADQGIGIETGEIPRLFDPFYRGSNAVGAQIRGAGIGLSLVKRIVGAHRGTIKIESKIGEGSTFTVAFPVLPQAGARHHAGDTESESARGDQETRRQRAGEADQRQNARSGSSGNPTDRTSQ